MNQNLIRSQKTVLVARFSKTIKFRQWTVCNCGCVACLLLSKYTLRFVSSAYIWPPAFHSLKVTLHHFRKNSLFFHSIPYSSCSTFSSFIFSFNVVSKLSLFRTYSHPTLFSWAKHIDTQHSHMLTCIDSTVQIVYIEYNASRSLTHALPQQQ